MKFTTIKIPTEKVDTNVSPYIAVIIKENLPISLLARYKRYCIEWSAVNRGIKGIGHVNSKQFDYLEYVESFISQRHLEVVGIDFKAAPKDEFLKEWGGKSMQRIVNEYHLLSCLEDDHHPFCQWFESFFRYEDLWACNAVKHEGIMGALKLKEVRRAVNKIHLRHQNKIQREVF
jgi:hypothetical protein